MIHPIWCCPLCHSDFSIEEKSWRCTNNHCFDIAKQGYVNLLPVHQKNSLSPGDNKEMLDNRRRFLNQGFYQPLAEALAESLNNDDSSVAEATVLDIGCGEGYFSHRIKQAHLGFKIYGIDISKQAIQMAAKAYKECEFSAASSANLPIKSHCLDFIIRNFAPSKETELHRVLKPNGTVITITPGEHHLHQLRHRIYDKVGPYQAAPEFTQFTLAKRHEVQFEMHFENKEQFLSLCKMTPFFWKMPKGETEQHIAFQQTESAHFVISEYKKC